MATIAAAGDFLSSDVKVYQTMVSIDNLDTEKLKPGMSAKAEIFLPLARIGQNGTASPDEPNTGYQAS